MIQAGAELCQAQVKLGWAHNLLPIYKKNDVSFDLEKKKKTFEVVFHFPNKLRPSSICLQIEVIFPFP
jgi:hypothetical protein